MKEGYGDFIKHHRLASGFKSQRRFAEKTGIDNSTISRIEQEIQKPEVRTLQTIAQYLESTSYVELMVACGYWDKDDLLEEEYPKNKNEVKELTSAYITNQNEQKETPASSEEEFLDSIDLTDEELLEQFKVKVDGQTLTEDETKGIIAYIRSLRTMK